MKKTNQAIYFLTFTIGVLALCIVHGSLLLINGGETLVEKISYGHMAFPIILIVFVMVFSVLKYFFED